MMFFESINPTTGENLATYPVMSPVQIAEAIEQAHHAYLDWKRLSYGERGILMNQLHDWLLAHQEEYAKLMTLEMGKPIVEARSEIEKCAKACAFYAKHAEGFLQPESVALPNTKSYVTFNPLGIVLAVMPWNFPFWQVFRFAVPALMAGNAAVLKHASNVTGCALAIEESFVQAGFPKNLFRSLIIPSDQVKMVIQHPRIQAVTLTGSSKAGASVAAEAGKCLKKTVLELGGSDPFIILPDADLDAAVETATKSRLINTGQSCIAAKRFIVFDSVRREFEQGMMKKFQEMKMGNPLDETNQLGPLARLDLREGLHQQVQKSLKQGAKLLWGGEIPQGNGAFYPPTILTDVKKGMPAYEEELFGPVAAILPVRDEAEAIRVANDSSFGLGATIFSRDLKKAEKIAAEEIEAGQCFVNAMVHSDPHLPFGGVKGSGYGRELSRFGIREFVNIKTVFLSLK